MVLVNFCFGRGHDCQPASDAQMSAVETRQMSSVETGQMSAAETGQMSAVETRQMSSFVRTDICLVPSHNVEVSELSSVPMLKSQKFQLWQCHNVQVSERRSGPKSPKMIRNGSRMVARS